MACIRGSAVPRALHLSVSLGKKTRDTNPRPRITVPGSVFALKTDPGRSWHHLSGMSLDAASGHLSGPEKKRRRPALACEQCRSRKVRCDRNLPCTTCKKSRNQLCTYAPQPTPKRSGNRGASSAVTSPSDPIAELAFPRHEPPIVPLRREPSRSNSHSAPGAASDPESLLWQPGFPNANQGLRALPVEAALTPESSASNTTIASLVDRVKQLEGQLNNALQRRGDPGECAALCRDEPRAAEHLDRGFVSKTRYFGRSHWMNAARLVRTSTALPHRVSPICLLTGE